MKNPVKNLAVLVIIAICSFLVGCATPQQVVSTQPDGSSATNTVYVPNQSAAQFAQTATAVAPLVPPPYGWILGLVGAATTATITTIANQKNRKKADQWEDIATTVFQGIESLGTEAAKVKEAVRTRSISDGNDLLVHAAVQREIKG